MKRRFFWLFALSLPVACFSQVNKAKVREDLDVLLAALSRDYVYVNERNVDLGCVRDHYASRIDALRDEDDAVLFFEHLLDEFHDSHMILNTNRKASYRLYSPFYVTLEKGKFRISAFRQNEVENPVRDVLGAELLEMNATNINDLIARFPTHCDDKNDPATREWIANKIVSGRYDEPRVLKLKLADGSIAALDVDGIKTRSFRARLDVERRGNIGIITINNSLGDNALSTEFDNALDSLMGTDGLFLDLRNTVDGGNTYIARSIMSRFTDVAKPYQKHSLPEQYDDNPVVERSWLEFVSPRGKKYPKRLVVLVGRWTGSMGEGLAIGLENVAGAIVAGTEMERLAGEMDGFPFKNRNYGFRIATAKLFHVNGTPREQYVPPVYVAQTSSAEDQALEKGLEILRKQR